MSSSACIAGDFRLFTKCVSGYDIPLDVLGHCLHAGFSRHILFKSKLSHDASAVIASKGNFFASEHFGETSRSRWSAHLDASRRASKNAIHTYQYHTITRAVGMSHENVRIWTSVCIALSTILGGNI